MLKLRGKRGSYSPIGMDIGRRGVRLVQLARHPHRAGDRLGEWWSAVDGLKAFCWDWSCAEGRAGR